jgi:hypothetical protein
MQEAAANRAADNAYQRHGAVKALHFLVDTRDRSHFPAQKEKLTWLSDGSSLYKG